MRRAALACAALAIPAALTGCTPTWKHDGQAQTLAASRMSLDPAPAGPADAARTDAPPGAESRSRTVSFTVPPGWSWYDRGSDLIATKDGVFLQHLFIERIHVRQVDQQVFGAFPFAAFSSKQWPTRTAKYLAKRFATGMAPADAADVFLDSRRHDPSVAELEVRDVGTCTVAGQPAFRATFEFRLKGSVLRESPVYRSACCGFVLDDWFYGVSYTAARRHYFAKDEQAFESFLGSIRLSAK